jgi:hypothetical protein
MQVNNISSQNFGARIKISKPAMADFRDSAVLSGLGTTASGIGMMSSVPATDPVHHIHFAAKIIDVIFAGVGGVASAIGASCFKISHSLFKNGLKNSKIPS